MSSKPTTRKINLDHFEAVLMDHLMRRRQNRFCPIAINYVDSTLIGRKNFFFRPILRIIKDFYETHDSFPNTTEILSRIESEKDEQCCFKAIEAVNQIPKDKCEFEELILNLETYVKQRSLERIFEKQIEFKTDEGHYDLLELEKAVDPLFGLSLREDMGFNYLEDIEKHIQDLLKSDNFISTGFPNVDVGLGGGICNSDVAFYVFGGGVNIGKSICMANLAVNILKQNYNVQVATFELSEKNWSKRISSIISGMELASLHAKTEDLRESVEELKRNLSKGKLNIKQFPAHEVTPKQYSAYLKQLYRVDKFKPDVIILDMHSLMLPNGASKFNMYQDQKDLAAQVRGLSYIWDCPVLSPTQLNIKDSSKRIDPGMEATLESQGIPQTADAQINFWQDEEAAEGGWIDWRVVKSRFSQKGVAGSIAVDYTNMRMKDLKRDLHVEQEEISDEEAFAGIDKIFLGT